MRDLRQLPKAELHLHLLAAMRPATFTELSVTGGFAAVDPQAFTTFAEFEAVFPAVFRTLRHPDHLRRLIREMVEDAAADGVVWVQPHFDPHVFPTLGSPDFLMELVLGEGNSAAARLGIGFGITIGAMRHLGPAAAVDRARFAARYASAGVYALGLTGDEAAFPASDYASAFAIARDAGLSAAPHAGELSGPESIRAAVEVLGATRIAHGVTAADDPSLVELLVSSGVSLDVCLTSNDLLGVAALDKHPLSQLMDAGVRCTLGADDPLMFGVGLLDEYRIARDRLGLSDAQLASLARTSIQTSGAPAHWLDRVDAWQRS
jgi:adenosine deaminase